MHLKKSTVLVSFIQKYRHFLYTNYILSIKQDQSYRHTEGSMHLLKEHYGYKQPKLLTLVLKRKHARFQSASSSRVSLVGCGDGRKEDRQLSEVNKRKKKKSCVKK